MGRLSRVLALTFFQKESSVHTVISGKWSFLPSLGF